MKKKLNNKGFALVETLVGAMFVSVVFIIIFENYFPLMAKYKRSENYDDLDSKYIAGYMRSLLYDNSNKSTIYTNLGSDLLKEYETKTNSICNSFDTTTKAKCNAFLSKAHITRIYLLQYSTSGLKTAIKNNTNLGVNISRAFELYVDYIPRFDATAVSNGANKIRLIVEIEHDDEKTDSDVENKYYTFANVEVDKGI